MSGDKRGICLVISDLDKALAYEWIGRELNKSFHLTIILIGERKTALSEFFRTENIEHYVISDDEYNSLIKKAYRLFILLFKIGPDVIHTHMWRANMLTHPIAWILRIPKRIFTRHHATIHYTDYPSGRKWDRFLNWLATDIIAISENIKDILIHKDGATKEKIRVIPHGFDLDYFRNVENLRVEKLRVKYGITESMYPVIGVISRYLEWKGIHYIIPAFKALQKDFPNAHLVLANTKGNYSKQIKALLQELSNAAYTEVEFENDLTALYRLFDIFVHIPMNKEAEAFGQIYVEALAAGTPSVFTLSGIAPEFIKNEYNAIVCEFQDSDSVERGIVKILNDEELRRSIIKGGLVSVEKYKFQNMRDALINLYIS